MDSIRDSSFVFIILVLIFLFFHPYTILDIYQIYLSHYVTSYHYDDVFYVNRFDIFMYVSEVIIRLPLCIVFPLDQYMLDCN